MKFTSFYKAILIGCIIGLSNITFAQDMQATDQPHTAVMTSEKQENMSPQQSPTAFERRQSTFHDWKNEKP